MPRILFEKTGSAIWISHLDLMRLFQRAFKRAGLKLTHTQGFNPRPSVSIALPLSVGVNSHCELLDFDLDEDIFSLTEIKERLNNALVSGVRVLDIYEAGRKLKELSLLSCTVVLEYDNGIPNGTIDAVRDLFCRDTLPVEKKSKNGSVEQDIIPLIRKLSVSEYDGNRVVLTTLVCCQNPAMNPMQLAQAVARYLPDHKPDHSLCTRIELYDNNENVFR